MFNKDDFNALAAILAGLQGKFLLSLNDVPEVREIFKDFKIEPVTVRYSASKTQRPVGKELLISNY